MAIVSGGITRYQQAVLASEPEGSSVRIDTSDEFEESGINVNCPSGPDTIGSEATPCVTCKIL